LRYIVGHRRQERALGEHPQSHCGEPEWFWRCGGACDTLFPISNESITLSVNTLNANLNVDKIVSTANIDYVTLLVSKTSFMDDATIIALKDSRDQQTGSLNLLMDLSGNANVANAKALFARVGVRTVGADQAIYSDIVRLK